MASKGLEINGDTAPEQEILELLKNEVLAGFYINAELLGNWQTELSDLVANHQLLAHTTRQEIVLQFPSDPVVFGKTQLKALETCLGKLEALDMNVYFEFKLIIYEVILCATTALYTRKIQLFKAGILQLLLMDYVSCLFKLKDDSSTQQKLLCETKSRLLSSFLELGCDAKLFKQILFPLFAKRSLLSFCGKRLLFRTFSLFLEKCPTSYLALLFNNFTQRPVSIPINSDLAMLNCFTVSTWLKTNSLAERNEDVVPVTLLLLANSIDHEALIFQVQLWNGKFIVNILNQETRSKRQFTFNQELKPLLTRNQGFTFFVLSYDTHQNLNLYIDGEYSESIPCSFVTKSDIRWNKLYIGGPLDPLQRNEPGANLFAKHELLVKDLAVMDIAMLFEWVSLYYFLGLSFDWSHKDFSELNIVAFLDCLSKENSVLMCQRVKEIMQSKGQQVSGRGSKQKNASNPREAASSSSSDHYTPSKQEIACFLAQAKVRNSNFLYDSNDSQFIEFIDQSRNQEILYHRFNSFGSSIFCWGGSGLLLSLIEAVMKDDYHDIRHRDFLVFESMRILLSCLSKDWRINKEFENIDGYWALAILLDHYKVNYNHNLALENWQDFEEIEIKTTAETSLARFEGSFLKMLLSFASSSKSGGLLVSDFTTFKVLIFNLELFSSPNNLSVLYSHTMDMLGTDRYRSHNLKEFNKMRILKRLIQHTKASLFLDAGDENVQGVTRLLELVISFDISVESIKCVSQFVIFALYNEASDEKSQEAGLQALLALTNKLCGPSSSIKLLKKFSRSISIHWILLLMDFQSENKPLSVKVVCCAIGLLSKFLRVLGPSVIRRFFHASRGLNVLNYFLQSWWNNDTVISVLFINSFGVESELYGSNYPPLPDLVKDRKITHAATTTPIPDYINLLNGLALTGIIQLSHKQGKVVSAPSSPSKTLLQKSSSSNQNAELYFDIMHLLNQMSDMIEIGFSESMFLQSIFVSKEWLEGAFEIVAHLKILQEAAHPSMLEKVNFSSCVKRFISVLSSIFVSMLLDVRKLVAILKSLSDITRKLMIDTIFPKIFEHINGFLSNSNFIFKELDFLRGATEILNIYYHEFILQNYFVSREDLNAYVTCLVAIIETSDVKSNVINQLGPILGHAVILQLASISHNTSDVQERSEALEEDFAADLNERVKFCLYKQALLLHPTVLNDAYLRLAIELIMGNFLKLSSEKQVYLSGYVLNFMRSVIVMREKDFGKITMELSQISDYQNSADILSEFFSYLSTHNDEETVKYIQKFPTLRHIISKNFHFRLSKLRDVGCINVNDMVQVVLNSGGRLGNTNTTQLQGFEKDCQTLKSAIILGELMKYNRELQDVQENIRFYSSSYSSLKAESHRLLKESALSDTTFTLDYIEGADRMRKMLVGEDQLPESEKLSYAMEVPLKKIDKADYGKAASLNLDSAFSALGIQDSSILESLSLESDLDEYEEIDENGESSSSKTVSYEDRNRKVLRSLYLGDQIQALFNVSKVNGLDAVESLMILGYTHIYFIESFFHCADGNVVDIDEAPSDLRDPYLQFIKPQSEETRGNRNHRIKTWSLTSVACVCKRKFLLRDIALELFFDDGASLLLTCLSRRQRDAIYTKLMPYSSPESLDKDLQITLEVSSSSLQHAQTSSSSGHFFRSRLASAISGSFTTGPNFSETTKKWRLGKMSNFYYLMCINTMAGRTFNDLTQYPVFPWVIADYESAELDLNDPKSFRDFSKPMGAQTTKRAEEYRERYEALAMMDDSNAPPFHYGTHYSSAMIVTSYLIRLKPYVQSYLLLQGGKFDHADRLFNSVGKAWLSASKDNTTDVRELTPEFFYLPEFLTNCNNFELGKLQNGSSPNDVALPRWSKGDPKIFIAKNREALESPHVSANLHKWIDLVFGYKQNGEEAVKALNVFHHLSYDGAINLDNIKDDIEKRAVIGMINNFGQTPVRLFTKPHPRKEILNLPYLQLSLDQKQRNTPICTFESKLHQPIEKLEVSAKSRKWIGRPACTSSEDQLLIRKPSHVQSRLGSGSLIINTTLFMNLHLSNITTLLQIGNKMFMTGSEDGIIQVWRCSLHPQPSVSYHTVLRGHLSAIRTLGYSKTFKVCLSVDADGGIIQWDLTRFKFVRRITNASHLDSSNVLVAISNDTGNFCTIHSTKYNNILTFYTLNGEKITHVSLKPGKITALAFAQANDSLVELIKTDYVHLYWKDEMIVLSYSSPQVNLQIYKLYVDGQGWATRLMEEAELKPHISGAVTAIQVYKQTEVCEEDKLCRGRLLFILGDSQGRVHVW